MKRLWVGAVVFSFGVAISTIQAQQPPEPQAAGSNESAALRASLGRDAQSRPSDPAALRRYAEFLDSHRDPDARDAYEKLLTALQAAGDSAGVRAAGHNLARLDLLAGDTESAARHMAIYSPELATRLPRRDRAPSSTPAQTVNIPGPLPPFARMAAISPTSEPESILSALARTIVVSGFRATSGEALTPTEYLRLLLRYISQAKEIAALAGPAQVLRIEKCESPDVGALLRVLGYRMRGGCGSELVLETVNATRAFITADSAFPITELEQALRTDRPFTYDFHPTAVPVLFGPEFWLPAGKNPADFIEILVSDQSLCRLYLALSKLDPDTAESLRKGISFTRLKAFAHVLDFFGGNFEIVGGKAVPPGGARTAPMWAELAGSPPDQGAAFFDKLVAKDDGWLASLYDAITLLRGPQADYFTEPARLKRLYTALRGRTISPGPARPVFRSNGELVLLTTRMWLEPDGKPHIPGGLDVWKNYFLTSPDVKNLDLRLPRQPAAWKDADDLFEVLFALCRRPLETLPLRAFMTLSDLDRGRETPFDPATATRLLASYKQYGAQYPILAESPALSGASAVRYLDAAVAIDAIRDQQLRTDSAGSLQALVGLWQILVRQQSIPASRADATFASITAGFDRVTGNRVLFDATRAGLKAVLAAAGAGSSGSAQDRLVKLLAGGSPEIDTDSGEESARAIERILDSQRVRSIDDLFQFSDQMDASAGGTRPDAASINKIATRISEVQLPRPSLSTVEKSAQRADSVDRHIDDQRKLNLRTAMEKAGRDPVKLRELSGLLAPLLRDALLAFNYAYYAPPGGQVLQANPLFVRSHDFLGGIGQSSTWRRTELLGAGWPANAGGRLTGSLASLPYALAQAEQNFLVPSQTQALIWADMVPQVLMSATATRWWRVTPAQTHWVALHLQYARELAADAAIDPQARAAFVTALHKLAPPGRTAEISRRLEAGDARTAVDRMAPSEMLSLARTFAAGDTDRGSAVLRELRSMAGDNPQELNYTAISRLFGTPKPTLTTSYRPELMNLPTLPTLMGYSSRILAESWESNTLYWAALSDELYLPVAELNLRIPDWTRQAVERIFASNLDDWPAMLRSLLAVGQAERLRSAASALRIEPGANGLTDR